MMHPANGLSLIELMVTLLVAMLFTGGVVMLLGSQSKLFSQQARLGQVSQSVRAEHARLARLLAQAEGNSIDILDDDGSTGGLAASAGTAVTVVFRVPSGFAIWPNDNDATYGKNAMQLQWTNQPNGLGTSSHSCTLYIRNTLPNSAYSSRQQLIGNSNGDENCDGNKDPGISDSGIDPKIINFELWPLDEDGQPLATAASRPAFGYRFTLTGASALPDRDYENPQVPPGSAWRHYRTASVSGIVMPRN